MSTAEAAFDLLKPWWLSSSSLGANESAELQKRWANPTPTISPGVINTNTRKTMAGNSLIEGAKRVVSTAANNPNVRKRIEEYYNKATGKVVDLTNVQVAQAAVSKGPAPASVMLRAAVRAGINPDDIFEGIILNEQRDAAANAVVGQLRTLYSQVSRELDGRATIHSNGALASALLNKEIFLFARRHYGSTQAVREAHAKLRAFLAMDTQALEDTIALHGTH